MAALTLRELGDASDAADVHGVLELFAACRETVTHVATSPLLPAHVAVATKNGFVELIDTATGEFRLFLTYLDRIPLDASLRCFSLVPSLGTVARLPGPRHPAYHLLYSLSYSNELLLAKVETGAVHVLAVCDSRPSVVQCDGDYIACGEGNGEVAVWQASAEERQSRRLAPSPPLLWKSRLLDSTVVCVSLHRDQLVCCSADYRCVVVGVEDGLVRSTLPLELDQSVAVFALTTQSLVSLQRGLIVCLRSRISVFAARGSGAASGAEAAAQPPPSSTATFPSAALPELQWSHRGDCALGREEVACASCLGRYLVVGTVSGLVLLYACDAAESLVTELVRFNVGYGVTGMQLFPNDTLLVVTSAGDVWRWPLSDLLDTADASGADASDEAAGEAEPTPAGEPAPLPLPLDAPGAAATASRLDVSLPVEPRLPATPHDVSYTHEGDVDDRNLTTHDASTAAAGSPHQPSEASLLSGERTLADPARGGDDSPVRAGARCRSHDEEGTPSVHLSTPTASVRAVSPAAEDDRDEPTTVLCLPPPPASSSSCSDKSDGGSGALTGVAEAWRQRKALYDPEQSAEEPEAAVDVDVDVISSAAGDSLGSSDGVRHGSIAAAAVSKPSSADTTAHHDAGSVTSQTEGLSGDRAEEAAEGAEEKPDDELLRPIRATHVNRAERRSDDAAGRTGDVKVAMDDLEAEFTQAMGRLLGPAVGIEGLRAGRRMSPRRVTAVLANLTNQQAAGADPQPNVLEGANSTALLAEKRAALEADAFDFAAYRDAHRLEVDALKFRHPVRAATYTLQDRVFNAVEPAGRLCDAGTASPATAAVGVEEGEDELRDVMHGKVKWSVDPHIAEERRRGGPVMAQHLCDDLLFPAPPHPANAAVLFVEDEPPLLPSTAWAEVLLLPLPLPPAPSVF
ncbi:suppressive immunomodulating factor [Novymonas esmeraldas]|uniref:Suppressive immunomodulating factor n=1 Tax=Novymonas esmeraldas TaxID=1808958 RepID=A0AAW0EVY7_9TRYP